MRPAALGAVALLVACAARGPALTVRPPKVDVERVRAERASHYDHAMRAVRAYYERLARVSAPLLLESASICEPKVTPSLGVVAFSPRRFVEWSQHLETQADLREAAARVLGARAGLTLITVTPGSSAEAAGARPGDVLRSVNGRAVTDPKDVWRALAAERERAPLLSLRRGDEEWDAEAPLRMACDVPIDLAFRPDLLAFWTPRGVTISTGMLDLLDSDDQLAFVLSHEIAHMIIDRGHGKPKQIERNADYLGCYLSARAGFEIAELPSFWRRWAALVPFGITSLQATHPGTPERALLLEATVEEIEGKRKAGLPLLPQLAE